MRHCLEAISIWFDLNVAADFRDIFQLLTGPPLWRLTLFAQIMDFMVRSTLADANEFARLGQTEPLDQALLRHIRERSQNSDMAYRSKS